MLDKYINIKDKQIIAGQTSSGIWYIKELPANNTHEMDQLINECNSICNKYNSDTIKEQNHKKLNVKGLK